MFDKMNRLQITHRSSRQGAGGKTRLWITWGPCRQPSWQPCCWRSSSRSQRDGCAPTPAPRRPPRPPPPPLCRRSTGWGCLVTAAQKRVSTFTCVSRRVTHPGDENGHESTSDNMRRGQFREPHHWLFQMMHDQRCYRAAWIGERMMWHWYWQW